MLGIAESFKKSSKKSTLAGVVMRRDLIIDGMAYGTATIEGDDATNSIISMHRLLARDDINCILLDGLVISMYNIIDGEQVAGETGLPVIAITFENSKGLENSIRHHFDDWQNKLVQVPKPRKARGSDTQDRKESFHPVLGSKSEESGRNAKFFYSTGLHPRAD